MASSRCESLCGALILPSKLFDHVLAHFEFLGFAAHRHRESFNKADKPRNFEVRNLSLTERANFAFVQEFAGAYLDPRADFLAILLIGHAEDLHGFNLRMPEKELLDLARIDVLSAANDHVLDPSDDVAIALFIDGGEVAGVHPAGAVDRRCRALWIFPITGHHRVTTG